MTSVAVKGKKHGTPNYKNDMLLNVIEAILPAGSEQWKTVASRYQIISGESTVRNHDDIRRYYMAKLCKNCKRQTGLNNKSAPTAIVARAQEIERKNFGGDNENDENYYFGGDNRKLFGSYIRNEKINSVFVFGFF